ncbi:MAG TPA: hypothetical protein PL166_12400, partial [Candidatus Contendobacter sp.]|nr:hypothetical protein [Candidatus Contendobacter sp.]
TPLQSVHYSDRYLRSPLTFVLLHELLNGLTCYAGGLAQITLIEITTAELNRLDAKQPRLLYHDWRDNEDRRQAIETWFSETWSNLKWGEAPLQKLPHARELTLTWNNGDCWAVRLDQGFGYWGAAPGVRPEFPFDNDVAQQVEKLRRSCFLLEPLNADYPTYWHCNQSSMPTQEPD